jgi:hypothetical protein
VLKKQKNQWPHERKNHESVCATITLGIITQFPKCNSSLL